MRSRLMTWEWQSKLKPGTDDYVLDFRKNRFIEPWALVQFVAHALWLRKQFQVPVHVETDKANPANNYVLAMGLEHVLDTASSTREWDESTQNTGLHVLRTHEDVSRFVDSAVRLSTLFPPEAGDALKYGMAELGRNVIQHAYSDIGGVAMAQFFPEARSIQVSIADRGRGLKKALESNYPELQSDLEAAKLAVLPHASGAPELLLRIRYKNELGPHAAPDNAGLGLFFCKEIAWRARGSFWLASDRALLGVTSDDQAAQHRIYRRINAWNGTSVTMHFSAEGIPDFADLLHICQNLARSARASSGEAGLDFVDELPEGFDALGDRIRVADFLENVEEAAAIRESKLIPAIESGGWIVLDFENVRFATQSFVHALLSEPLRRKGGLLRLSFFKCTRATKEAIQTVAAYAASYLQMQ